MFRRMPGFRPRRIHSLIYGTIQVTRSMTSYKPADIVLVRFPFTDRSVKKKRPAMVVSGTSLRKYHDDLTFLPITSQDQRDPQMFIEEWKQSGLMKPSWFARKIATIHAGYVSHKIGELSISDMVAASVTLSQLIDPVFSEPLTFSTS